MSTFGKTIAEARKALGISQKELAAQIKKEDGQPISPQYLNDIEHDRRNPPSEPILEQLAKELKLSKDRLLLAAGTLPEDLRELAAAEPEKAERALRAFRKVAKKS